MSTKALLQLIKQWGISSKALKSLNLFDTASPRAHRPRAATTSTVQASKWTNGAFQTSNSLKSSNSFPAKLLSSRILPCLCDRLLTLSSQRSTILWSIHMEDQYQPFLTRIAEQILSTCIKILWYQAFQRPTVPLQLFHLNPAPL